MRRFLFALPMLALLVACGDATRDLQEPTDPIGDFQIGHIGVVAPNLQKLLVSRDATEEEWIDELTDALALRFNRYEGGKFYHLGISVEAYSLPPPIIPGRSALALNVTLWDDAAQAKMNEDPKQVQIIRVIEARMASTKESQMQWLGAEAAKEIELWMREMQESDGWFAGTPDADQTPTVEDTAERSPTSESTDAAQPVVVPENVLAVTNSVASGTVSRSQ